MRMRTVVSVGTNSNMGTPDESKRKNSNIDSEEKDDPAKVHSANSWETADLGDDDRNKKFLRLMGASKADHHGRFIIGEKDVPAHAHCRDKKQVEDIEHDLEDQFNHTFEHRITKWSHKGIGFDDEKKEPSPLERIQSTETESKQDSEKTAVSDSKSDDQSARKRENTEPAKNPDSPPKKPKMMMNFVKATCSD